MSYRPALAAQLEKLNTLPQLDAAIKIDNRTKREIPMAVGFGAGCFIATQLVLRYRFGNI